MIKVVIIGSGNLATHLIDAFNKSHDSGSEIEVVQAYARNTETLNSQLDFDKTTTDLDTLAEADLYIIAVSDDAIEEVSSALPFKNRLVVHTSGGVSLDSLSDDNRKGVFYPLQTFSKSRELDFSTIPIALESQNATDFQLLEKVARSISSNVQGINSEQRKALHVAAVLVNNFTNHLYAVANEICIANQVPFDMLKPLIMETAEKVMTLPPKEAQTGPAKRRDNKTLHSHIDFLQDDIQKEIYKLLTQSIQHYEL